MKCRVCILHRFLSNVNTGSEVLVSSMGPSPRAFNWIKELWKGHFKTINLSLLTRSLVAELLGAVWQRSAAGWDPHLLGKVIAVIGNCIWASNALLNDESQAALVCQMFIPDVFDEFMVHVGKVASVAICLQLWCFSCCLGCLNIKYYRTTQRSQLCFSYLN